VHLLNFHWKINADDTETCFWSVIYCSSLYATQVTCGQSVVLKWPFSV